MVMFKITTSFKRMALMMVLAISGTISVLAGNRLVLNDGGPIAIKPGETKEITVNLVNDEVIYAMQFDMDFTSPNVEIVPGSFKINEDRIDRECFIATMIQQPDMKWRIALLTKDFTPIAGTEGALGTFKIRATSNFSSADDAQILFSTCSGGDRQGKKVLIDCPNYQAITPMVGSLCTGEQAFSIKPGGTHKVDVVLKNDIYFCGLQADITLPEGLHIEKKSNGKMNFQYSERLSSNFAISSGEKNGIVRVALSSLPIDKIQPYKDGDGVIFSFNVVADPDFATDENSAIVFSNVLAANETTEYSLDITDAHVSVTSLKPINDAAYARLAEEVAALQKALDDAKAKVAEECPDVAENYAETVETIQSLINAIQSDLDAKNADCALTETSTLDAEAVKGVNDAIAKYINEAAAAAYVRLTEAVAAVQARFDEVKATIEKDYANVAAQFADAEAAIQGDIDQKKAELQAQYKAVKLSENSTIDLEAIKAAVEQLLADAKAANAKLVANEAAYVRLTEEIAAVQARFDEVKATIEKDYANVSAQFADAEAAIQADIDQKKAELQAQYEAVKLDENSTIDLEAIKAAVEQLLANAKLGNAKLVANELAYVRLSDEIAAVQARLDEVKATIEKDYANVSAQFVDTEAAIQGDIDQKKAELQAQYEAVKLDENSTIDLEAIKAAIEQLLADAKVADAKLVANEAAYVRLSDEIAAVQTRLDEVKATIEKDYAIVAAQFVGVESSIQYDINKKKDELKAQYEAVELDENSTIDLETIKTAIEQLLADAKAAAEANSIGSIQRLMSEGATFYTLGGQKVEAPCKGNIYMIRHADGSVKKVYIK